MTIRDFFQHVFPMSAAALNKEFDCLSRRLNEMQAQLEERAELVVRLEEHERSETERGLLAAESLREAGERQLEAIDRVQNTANEAKRIVWRSANPFLFNNIIECRAIRGYFRDAMERDDFAERYLRLVSGLSFDDRRAINRILTRLRLITDGTEKPLKIFTSEETAMLTAMTENFQNEILKVSDELYCYGGYMLPVDLFDPSVFFSRYGVDTLADRELIRQRDILDVGGYVGDSALILSGCTDRSVYIFEPSPESCAIIKKTLELNNVHSAVLENLALSDKNGSLTLHLGERSSCNTVSEREGYEYTGSVEVPCETLDSYIARHPEIDVGLIKVDIEGEEQAFLRGAVETIKRFRPTLLVSIYHTADDFFDIKPMIERLGLGYGFRIFKPAVNSILMETVLIAQPGGAE